MRVRKARTPSGAGAETAGRGCGASGPPRCADSIGGENTDYRVSSLIPASLPSIAGGLLVGTVAVFGTLSVFRCPLSGDSTFIMCIPTATSRSTETMDAHATVLRAPDHGCGERVPEKSRPPGYGQRITDNGYGTGEQAHDNSRPHGQRTTDNGQRTTCRRLPQTPTGESRATSNETYLIILNSTLRFSCLPSGVALSATGTVSA